MTTPLTLAAIFASPAMFPDLHPLAVWIGMGCIAVALWALWKADEWGSCETTLRAIEARDLLERMNDRRVA